MTLSRGFPLSLIQEEIFFLRDRKEDKKLVRERR